MPVVPPVYCSTARSSGSIATRGMSDGVAGPVRSASVSIPSILGAGAAAAEYSASDVTTICSIEVCALMPCRSGASASVVITMRTFESAAMTSPSRAV